jgi:dsDNA-specific endonuclease/ATPase MutS2
MSSEKLYKVTVSFPTNVPAVSRSRAGIEVSRDEGYVGPLTKEQLEEIEDDSLLTVVEVSGEDSGSTDEAQAEAAKIVSEAQAEADKIVADAKEAAAKVADDAKTKGEDILKAAQAQADKIAADSQSKSK